MIRFLASAASEKEWRELIFICVIILAFAWSCH